MIKISKKLAKIGLILSSIMLIIGILVHNVESIKFYSLLCVVNLVALFLDRIMNDIQKILDKIYEYIK